MHTNATRIVSEQNSNLLRRGCLSGLSSRYSTGDIGNQDILSSLQPDGTDVAVEGSNFEDILRESRRTSETASRQATEFFELSPQQE